MVGHTGTKDVRNQHMAWTPLTKPLSECQEATSASRFPGAGKALQDQVARIQRFVDILDHDALDQLREIVNRVTTMELRASGKFV